VFGHPAKLADVNETQRQFQEVSSSERQHPRYAHEVSVTIHFSKQGANGKPAKAKTEGRTSNVSRGGLAANIADEIKAGTDIEVDIVLVFDDEMQSEALRLPARIAWCTAFEDMFQVGVSFKPLDADRANYLQLFLKYMGEERATKAPRTKTLDIDKRFG
jgi:hypothetical protein